MPQCLEKLRIPPNYINFVLSFVLFFFCSNCVESNSFILINSPVRFQSYNLCNEELSHRHIFLVSHFCWKKKFYKIHLLVSYVCVLEMRRFISINAQEMNWKITSLLWTINRKMTVTPLSDTFKKKEKKT